MEKEGSLGAVCCIMDDSVLDRLLCEGWRGRTGIGGCGGASTMAVSEELLLPVEDRDRDCGVEVREAIISISDESESPCGIAVKYVA